MTWRILTPLLFFGLGVAADWVTVLWHRGREQGKTGRTAGLSMVLEALSWTPLWFAIRWDRPSIAVASIVGSGLGTYLGMRGWREA